jgi:hypothetical protein
MQTQLSMCRTRYQSSLNNVLEFLPSGILALSDHI